MAVDPPAPAAVLLARHRPQHGGVLHRAPGAAAVFGEAGRVALVRHSASMRDGVGLDGDGPLPVDQGFAQGESVDLVLELLGAEALRRRLCGVDREGVLGEPAAVAR